MITALKNSTDAILFKDLNYYPILDNQAQASKGYISQRISLKHNIRLSKFLCTSFENESFLNIFKMTSSIGDEIIFFDKIQKEINNKLNNFLLPNDSELEDIINLKLEGRQNEIRYDFLKRLYVF